jgi:hypothetical protein
MKIEHALKLPNSQQWKYETDIKNGVCAIANEDMVIKFSLEFFGSSFYDVLEIEKIINKLLDSPVSVEGAAHDLGTIFKGYRVTASGRSEGHGWITSSSQQD